MPGVRGKRDRLFQEWTQHSGLPEEAVPELEAEAEPEVETARRRYALPVGGLNFGSLPSGSWLLILLGVGVVLSIVNLILLAIVLYVLTNFVT
jgi:hypothetical protein